MNKKILCLVLCGVLALPLAGCSLVSNVKEIFSFNEKKEEEEIYTPPVIKKEEPIYSIPEIIEMVKVGTYSLEVDGEIVDTLIVQDIINAIFNEPYWQASMIDNNNAKVVAYSTPDVNNENTSYICFHVNLTTGDLTIDEMLIDGIGYSGEEANTKFAEIMAELSDKVVKKEPVKKQEEKKKQEDKGKDPMEETNGKHYVALDYVCAQCGTQMYNTMIDGTHEDDFCSVACQDKWYNTQKELNENKYNCEWCGAAMNQYQYDAWFGCCSEICAVNREGAAHENEERDELGITPGKDENMYNGPVPDGGVSICGWCGARLTDESSAFCSNVCEQAHRNNIGQ